MGLLRKILFPFSVIYALIISIRNLLFDVKILKSVSYDFPVICVGNLSVGGTGKTPMVEYLIRLMKDATRIAILSRGYKRKSKGFLIADKKTTVLELGDEPYQYYSKYNDIIVAVDSNRKEGIAELSDLRKPPSVIILDDAFQHRRVKAGLNVLLTVYNDLYSDDYMLPTGNLRDNRREAKRANIIVVTKCPNNLSSEEKNIIIKKVAPKKYQKVFFTTIRYSTRFYTKNSELTIEKFKEKDVTLVTGIANSSHLVDHMKAKGLIFDHLNFKDHHYFTTTEISMLSEKETIITTEKDYVRLNDKLHNVYYLPIEIEFLFGEEPLFNKALLDFVKEKSGDHSTL